MIALGIVAFTFLVLLLLFLSLIEYAVTRPSRLTLKVLADKENHPRHKLLCEIANDRRGFLMPIQFASQIVIVCLSVTTVALLTVTGFPSPVLSGLVFMLLVVLLFRQLIPRLATINAAAQLLLALLPLFGPVNAFLRLLGGPLVWLLGRYDERNGEAAPGFNGEDEATEEEIQAYLGVGEEEGIFERGESRLIQSALEFRNTLVREIMTPRNEVVTIDEEATMADLRDLIVSSKHSRIPVYRERMDQIVGIVYVRNLLTLLQSGRERDPIAPLMSQPFFVPETKNVAHLLKEMQARTEHMAVVVNEYGAVSGIVTIEDLLEEIVGEIHDEDELVKRDFVYEGDGNYFVRGGAEVEILEQSLGIQFGQRDVTTISGLIVSRLGSVPVPGQSVMIEGVSAEILSADEKKILSLRIRNPKQTDPREFSDDSSSGPIPSNR